MTPADEFFRDLQARVPKKAHELNVSLMGVSVIFRSTHKKLLRPFEHMPRVDIPGFTIHAWDSAGDPNWDYVKKEVRSLVSDRYSAVFEGDRLFALDRQTQQGFFWTPSLEALSVLEASTPFRPLLHWWALDRGLQLTHTAAVGGLEGGVLLVGKGGAGKSTTALACLLAGMGYVSDDYCLIGKGPYASSLYGTGKLDDQSLRKLPLLSSHISAQEPQGKTVFDLRAFRKQLLPGFPLRAVLVPKIQSGTCTVQSISKVQALTALVPSTVFQLPFDGAKTFRQLSDVVNQLPCYLLSLGPHAVDEAPGIIADLLGQL